MAVPRSRVAAYAAALVVFLGLLFRAILPDKLNVDTAALTVFALIGATSIFFLARYSAEDGISFAVIFWFWSLMSLAFAPAAILLAGKWTFGLDRPAMLKANALLVAYHVLFVVVYLFARRRAENKTTAPRATVAISHRALLIVVALAAIVTLALHAKSGFRLASSPVLALFPDESRSNSFLLMFDLVVRSATGFVFLLAARNAVRDRSRTNVMLAIVAGITAVAMVNPLSSSRFFIFTMYFGAFIVLFSLFWMRRFRFVFVTLLFAALLASSAINYARLLVSNAPPHLARFAREDGALTLRTIFYSGHFDSYEIFVHTVAYVRDRGLTQGRQFLGAVLFFVPRRLWPDKPVGTGAFVAEEYLRGKYRVIYTNLSSPPIGEGYINFGTLGVIGAAVILGLLFGWLDGRARHYANAPPSAPDLRTLRYATLYPIAVAYSLFYLRGDMLSGNAYFVGIAAGYFIVERLVVRRA